MTWQKTLGVFTPCCCIPQRYILGIMTCLSIFCSYTMRSCLSIGITEMVRPKNKTEQSNDTSYCPIDDKETYHAVQNEDVLYDWNEEQQSLILTSFYWSYILTHIPGAYIAEKVGGKHVLGLGMLMAGILTLFQPMIIMASGGAWDILIIVRFMMGLGQGVVYPVVTAIIAQWIPPNERSTWSSVSFSGALFGNVLGNGLSGVLIREFKHWNVIFYFFGGLGLLWNLMWQLICYSYPRIHPCIKEKEKDHLEKELAQDVSKVALETPWKEILTSVPVWALIIGEFGHDWGWFILATHMPKYMHTVLRFNVRDNGFVSALPYLVMIFSTIFGGWLADTLISKKVLSTKAVRLIIGTLGQTGPAVFLMAGSYVGCNKIAAVAMLTLAMAFMGLFYPGMKVNALDLAPNFAGTIMAIVNGIGVIGGIIAPYLIAIMAPNQTLYEYRNVFWLAFGWLVGTNIIFVIFMSAEVQKWNQSNKEATEAAQ